MSTTLQIGLRGTLSLELPASVAPTVCDAPRGEPLADVQRAVATALANPLNFPPLGQAAVPGDRVVLALDSGVPQAPAIVAAVFECLVARSVEPADMTILRTQADERAGGIDPREALPAAARSLVRLEVHDPAERDRLSLLGTSTAQESVYLNRALCEADLVIPIGCLRCEGLGGFFGKHGGLYPTFSDTKSAERVRVPSAAGVRPEDEPRQRERIAEVGWMLGVQFTVQVVPGARDTVLAVFAGAPDAVFDAGQTRCRAAWECAVSERAALVVATLDSAAASQTWDNVGHASAAASRVVRDEGAIVLCTDLEAPLGPAMTALAECDDPQRALARIRKERSHDAAAAIALIHAMERSRVYLLSRLPAETVESLGMTPIAAAEIARLASRSASCIILTGAQHVLATVAGEVY